MTANFTTAPWLFSEIEQGDWQVFPQTCLGPDGARWYQDSIASHIHTEDDARLIANAPRLLNALEELVRDYCQTHISLSDPAYRAAHDVLKDVLKDALD